MYGAAVTALLEERFGVIFSKPQGLHWSRERLVDGAASFGDTAPAEPCWGLGKLVLADAVLEK